MVNGPVVMRTAALFSGQARFRAPRDRRYLSETAIAPWCPPNDQSVQSGDGDSRGPRSFGQV